MANKEHLARLKQGVEVWNKWRKKNLEIQPDLRGADLREADLRKAILREADLRKAILREADLSKANLRGAYLSKANLRGAYLSEANLIEAYLSEAYLIEADFSKAYLKGSYLSELNLSKANLRGANLIEANLRGADLSGTDLRGTNLNEAYLKGVNLNGAYLKGANLRGADLSGTDLRGMDLRGTDLIGVNLRGTNLIGVNLRGTNLSEADLSEADLSEVNLSEVNLSEADLSEVNLSEAILSRTKALKTKFEGATFTGACIEDWHTNSKTNLNNVICDYVYLKEGKQERRPHDLNRNFVLGEFSKIFQKVLETVDLIFSDGIDWKATDYSLNNTQVLNENTPVAIQSIENKGDGFVLIRISVPKDADKHKIESDFWQGYEFAHKALEAQYQIRIEDRDKEINRLFLLVNQAQEKLGEVPKLMSEASKYDMRGSNFQGGFAEKNYGRMVETQHNYAPEQKQTLAEAAVEIQKLLKQLEQNNPTATIEQQQAFVDAIVPPTLKAKFVSALQAGWKEGIKEFLDNPYFNVGVAILEGWQEAEGN